MSFDEFDRDDFFGGDDDQEPLGDGFGDLDFGDEEADLPVFDGVEDVGSAPGTIMGLRRPFFYALVGGGGLLLIAVVVLVLVIAGGAGPSEAELQSTVIAITNQYVLETAIPGTETQQAVDVQITGTAEAVALAATGTAESENMAATQTAEAATNTPVGTETPTPSLTPFIVPITPTGGSGGGIPQTDLDLTATALAVLLTPLPITGVPGQPTVTPGGVLFVTPTPVGTSATMPQTGFFDDIGEDGGAAGLAVAGLVAIGLGAVIVVARGLRAENKRNRNR